MTVIPPYYGLILSGLLFVVGLLGLLIRRNIMFMLISVEVMLNASGLAFIAGGALWGSADGQSMFLFILALAATEVAIGLALILRLHKHRETLDSDRASELRG